MGRFALNTERVRLILVILFMMRAGMLWVCIRTGGYVLMLLMSLMEEFILSGTRSLVDTALHGWEGGDTGKLWLSVDPLWPDEMAYGYVEGRVMTGVDYWGMSRKDKEGKRRNNKGKGTHTHGRPTRRQQAILDKIDRKNQAARRARRITKFIPIVDDFLDLSKLFQECIYNPLNGAVAVNGSTVILQKVSGEEQYEECEHCCRAVLRFAMDTYVSGATTTFGATVGFGGGPFGGIAGTLLGNAIGGALGDELGDLLGNHICPDLCIALFDPCSPKGSRSTWDLNPFNKIDFNGLVREYWPTLDDWSRFGR